MDSIWQRGIVAAGCNASGGSRKVEHIIPSDSFHDSFQLIVQSTLHLFESISRTLSPSQTTRIGRWLDYIYCYTAAVSAVVGNRSTVVCWHFAFHQNHKNEHKTFRRHEIIISNQCVARDEMFSQANEMPAACLPAVASCRHCSFALFVLRRLNCLPFSCSGVVVLELWGC